MTATISDDGCEIISTRVFPWPPATVCAAWLDPARLARWWGPRGFTNTFEVCDPRPGGDWRFVMHGPDGKDYPNQNRFIAIEAPGRIVIEHVSDPHFVLTATFEAGHFEYDSTMALMRLDDARALLGVAGPTGLQLRLADRDRAGVRRRRRGPAGVAGGGRHHPARIRRQAQPR